MSWARIALLALGLGGCASAPAKPQPAPVRAAPQAEIDRSTPARIETATYLLELTNASAERVSLLIEGRGEYHMNLEFPLRVELTASGARLDKASLGPSDAAELAQARVRFEIPVHMQVPGERWLSARVLFAVCTPASCVPAERTLALALNAP